MSGADAARAQTRPGATHDNSVYCQNSPGLPARPGPQGYGRTGTNSPFGGDCARQPAAPTPSPPQPTRQRFVDLASVAWISEHPNPFDAVPLGGGGLVGPMQALAFQPDWVVKVYLGLIGTANGAPPTSLIVPMFKTSQQYRALMHVRVALTTNAQTGEPVSASPQPADPPDPGWTPPFDQGRFPPTFGAPLLQFLDKCQTAMLDRTTYAGQAGQLSGFVSGRHPNSVLQLDPGERILVDGVIRFRAGKHTDDVGLCVGSPNHVPWVWNEIALTWANGKYWVRGAASAFPTTWWYVARSLVRCQARVADSGFPLSGGILGVGAQIDVNRLAAGPALTAGAPKSEPQAPDARLTGPVDRAPYTVPQPGGGNQWRRALDDPPSVSPATDGSC